MTQRNKKLSHWEIDGMFFVGSIGLVLITAVVYFGFRCGDEWKEARHLTVINPDLITGFARINRENLKIEGK